VHASRRRSLTTLAGGGLALASAPTLTAPMRTLAPCPDRPNCVSSLASEAARRVEPIAYRGEAPAAQARLAAAIEALPRSRIVEQTPGWIAAEFRSWLFGFVDEAQFALDPAAGVFQVRSAARTGYWDLGVNRQRVEALRAALAAER
jgi:uncharacterized protein (DUF1499 family)